MVKHAVKILLCYLETKATKYSYVELVLFSFCHPGGPLRYKLSLPFFVRNDCTKGRTEKYLIRNGAPHFDFATLHIMGKFEQLARQAKRYVSVLFTSNPKRNFTETIESRLALTSQTLLPV